MGIYNITKSIDEWNISVPYSIGTIVRYNGKCYQAIQDVPKGVNVGYTEYWDEINEDSDIDDLKNEVDELEETVGGFDERIAICEGKVDAIEEAIDSSSYSVSGNPVQFTTNMAQTAKGCLVEVEHTQNLHGYDYPWVGGAGKNKVPLTLANFKTDNTTGIWTDNKYTISGAEYTVLTDDSDNVIGIETGGLATTQVGLGLGLNTSISLPAGTYILSGAPSGSTLGNYDIYVRNTSTNTVIARSYDDSTASEFTLEATTSVSLTLRINEGGESVKTFYPMIRLSSVADATFEPYTNICPIGGLDNVKVRVAPNSTDEPTVTTVQLGQMVYGGTVDVEEGVLTVNKINVTYRECDNVVNTVDNRTLVQFAVISTSMTDYSYDYLCDKFNTGNAKANNNVIGSYYYNNRFRVRFPENYGLTKESINNILSNNPISFVYPLDNPTIIQLTPTEIELLNGNNYITTNAEEVTIEYVGKFATQDELNALKADLTANDNPFKFAYDETSHVYGFLIGDTFHPFGGEV